MAAINKRKMLASAQRNVQKGALDKALKDYETILKADPRDANVRLKLGDLLLRRNKAEEAVAAYLKVADQFMRDGFDAKAVAIYKQVTKIDPKRIDIQVPLADLYQRLGLVSEAMTALQAAADAYHRDGRKREALDLLRRMASLDPSNVTSRLKVADLLRQEGLGAEALAEYEEAAAELDRQGDWEARVGVLERILEISPGHAETLAAAVRIRLEHGQASRCEALAQKLVEVDAERAESHELRASVLEALGRTEEAAASYRSAAEIWRTRGDEDRARAIMQRHVPSEPFDLGERDTDSPTLDVGDLGEGERFDPPFGAEGEGIGGQVLDLDEPAFGEHSLDLGEPALPSPPPDSARPPASAADESAEPAKSAGDSGPPAIEADADIDQLLAETAVYLRYGKHERAVAALRAILTQDPSHVAALEQLGQALEATGERDSAVEAWTRAARAASAAGDHERFEALRGKIQALDASAAGALEAPSAAPGAGTVADDERPPDTVLDLGAAGADGDALEDIDIDIDDSAFDIAEESAPEEPLPEPPPRTVEGPEPGLEDIEIDTADFDGAGPDGVDDGASLDAIGFDEALASAGGKTREDAPEDAEPGFAGSGVGEAGEEVAVADARVEGSPNALSTSTSQRILGDLEEANFYMDQGLLPEAESIYRRILEVAPSHPGALLRLGEIAASRGQDPPASVADVTDSTQRAVTSQQPFALPEREEELTPELAEPPGVEAPPAPEELSALDDASEPEEPPVFDVDESPTLDDEEPVDEPPRGLQQAELTAPELPVPEAEEEGASFDLAAELSHVFDDDEPEAAGVATDEDGFESIFRDFKRGVSETLSEGDFETHFDLGIAYREMGLLDDAISEFHQALGSEERRLDALHLMGQCALELGRFDDSVGHLEQALATADSNEEREVPLRFDLGRAYEASGDRERALDAFRRVSELDADFQDVAARLEALAQSDGAPQPIADEPREAYESFDDLVTDAGDDDEAAQASPAAGEGYESFEEFLDDDEASENDESEDAAEAGVARRDAADSEPSQLSEDDAEEAAVTDPPSAEADIEIAASGPTEAEASEPDSSNEPKPEAESTASSEVQPDPETPSVGGRRRRRKVSFF